MDTVCRLCLRVEQENMVNLFGNQDIWHKLSSTLNIVISQELFLPKSACVSCIENIEQTHNFHQMLKESQNILTEKLNQGIDVLHEYVYSLKKIKTENKDSDDDEDSDDYIKIENGIESINERHKETCKGIADNEKIDINIKNKGKITRSHRKENLCNNIDSENNDSITNDETADIPLNENDESTIVIKEEAGFKSFLTDDRIEDTSFVECKIKAIKNLKNKKYSKEKTSECDRVVLVQNMDDKHELVSEKNVENSENQNKHKCPVCFQTYSSIAEIKDHYKNVHRVKFIWSEGIDKNNFKKLKQNGKIMYKCGYCDKLKTNDKNIKQHIRCAHNVSHGHICNLCGTSFRTTNQLFTHYARAHYEGDKFVCSFQCGYSSCSKSNLKDHEARHKRDYKFKCDTCGRGFFVKTQIEDHMNEHKGIKPYVCTVCGLAYFYKHYLASHEVRAHQMEVASKKGRYHCKCCDYSCSSKVLLNKHLDAAHGLKQSNLCDICGKSFQTKSHLAHHKKCHGNRNFSCTICKKSFGLARHLRRHELTHLSVKPYPCDKCEKRYTRADVLKHHKLSCRGVAVRESKK